MEVDHVYYGCANDRFGGCGSVLSIHTVEGKGEGGDGQGCVATLPKGVPCTPGIMAEEAVNLLRTFYERGNPNCIVMCPLWARF